MKTPGELAFKAGDKIRSYQSDWVTHGPTEVWETAGSSDTSAGIRLIVSHLSSNPRILVIIINYY